MPSTKLTLRLDERLIELGKQLAQSRGTSLSQLLAEYIKQLSGEEGNPARLDIPAEARDPGGPWGIALSEELDRYVSRAAHDPGDAQRDRQEYMDHLDRKYDS